MAQDGLLGTGAQSKNRTVRRSAKRILARPAPPPRRTVAQALPAVRAVVSRPRPRPAPKLKPRKVVRGKVSWFGGPHDATTGPMTAANLPITTPGIAVYNRHTLGGFWRVELPRQKKVAILRQTDLGPAPWTGRKVDVTYSALKGLGFTEKSFPTDAKVRATYLGKQPRLPY